MVVWAAVSASNVALPVRGARSNVVPSGMGRVDEAGFYFRKARSHYGTTSSPEVEKSRQGTQRRPAPGTEIKIQGPQEQPKF